MCMGFYIYIKVKTNHYDTKVFNAVSTVIKCKAFERC